MVKMNLASGPALFAHGWINIDKDPSLYGYINFLLTTKALALSQDIVEQRGHAAGFTPDQVRLKQEAEKTGIDFRLHDLLTGIPAQPETVEMIYCGSFIEHINPVTEAPLFLRRCFHALKPGGLLRLTTPNLESLIRNYLQGEMSRFDHAQPAIYKKSKSNGRKLGYLLFGSLGEKSTWNNYEGHQMAYDYPALEEMLREVGYVKIERWAIGQSRSPVMEAEMIEPDFEHILIVEAEKPRV